VCLAFARRVVEAKLHNAATLVVRFGFDAAPERGAELRALRDACGSATTVHQVLGYEGRGARLYFEGWAASLDATWGFTRRIKHPSPDPINALLSLTYTVLHQHVGSALVAAGLDPRIGLIHRERGAHHALASDLQEEFRHLAEGVVWSGVRHGWITPDQFALVGGDAPVSRMTGELRRRVVRTMEQRLFSEFTPLGGGRRTYREFMDGQARRFAELLGDGMSGYRPLRLRA
jgi:CRISPR-associated protein Cas1